MREMQQLGLADESELLDATVPGDGKPHPPPDATPLKLPDYDGKPLVNIELIMTGSATIAQIKQLFGG